MITSDQGIEADGGAVEAGGPGRNARTSPVSTMVPPSFLCIEWGYVVAVRAAAEPEAGIIAPEAGPGAGPEAGPGADKATPPPAKAFAGG